MSAGTKSDGSTRKLKEDIPKTESEYNYQDLDLDDLKREFKELRSVLQATVDEEIYIEPEYESK
jgi:hypothetical protein